MPAVLVTLTILLRRTPASFINFLHYCSPSSGFYGAREDNRGICTDNPSGRHPIRTMGALTSSVIPPLPLLPQPSQFTPAWDRHRIMLACMPSGLVTQWLGHPKGSGFVRHMPRRRVGWSTYSTLVARGTAAMRLCLPAL